MSFTLTDQQQAVVDHPLGPALVFAVAGAGKTTAMVHRIERLVREGVFAPERILATSFGTANVDDLTRALRAWPHCRTVDIRTLHSLGYDLVRRAIERGYLRLKPEVIDAERVFNAMLVEARYCQQLNSRPIFPASSRVSKVRQTALYTHMGHLKENAAGV